MLAQGDSWKIVYCFLSLKLPIGISQGNFGVFGLQAHLWSARKQLSVLVGALKSPEPAVSVSPFALRANKIEEMEEEELEDDCVNGNGYTSPLIMRFFQVSCCCPTECPMWLGVVVNAS